MKNVYLLGLILAATTAQLASVNAQGTPAVAGSPAGCPKAFQGFHLGGNVGYGLGWVKHKVTSAERATAAAPFVNTASHSNDLAVKGFDGGVGVGYTHRVCNWAFGIAFDANWAGTKGTLHEKDLEGPVTSTFTPQLRLKNSLQLYGRVGYVLREIAMPFIGLGWDNSQWERKFNVASTADVAAGNPAYDLSGTSKKRLNSFLWKVGVDFLATKHVVVGFEYTGTTAGNKGFSKTFTRANGTSADRISNSVKPQYNKFALTAKIVY